MDISKIKTKDGAILKYATSRIIEGRPWMSFIIPFGLDVSVAFSFMDFFSDNFNIVTWESRSILVDSSQPMRENEYNICTHANDLHLIHHACRIKRSIFVGYCSGAGIALAAANRFPNLCSSLVLAHGEYALLSEKECTTQFSLEIDRLLSLAAKDENCLNLVYEKIKDQRSDNSDSLPDGLGMPYTNKEYFNRYSKNYISYKNTDFEYLAGNVGHKTLLISGQKDVQANCLSTHKIASLIKNSMVHIDPNADHFGLLRTCSNTMITIWNYLCADNNLIATK